MHHFPTVCTTFFTRDFTLIFTKIRKHPKSKPWSRELDHITFMYFSQLPVWVPYPSTILFMCSCPQAELSDSYEKNVRNLPANKNLASGKRNMECQILKNFICGSHPSENTLRQKMVHTVRKPLFFGEFVYDVTMMTWINDCIFPICNGTFASLL